MWEQIGEPLSLFSHYSFKMSSITEILSQLSPLKKNDMDKRYGFFYTASRYLEIYYGVSLSDEPVLKMLTQFCVDTWRG